MPEDAYYMHGYDQHRLRYGTTGTRHVFEEPLRDIDATNAGVVEAHCNSPSVFVPGLPPLRSPTVPHADAAVILPYC